MEVPWVLGIYKRFKWVGLPKANGLVAAQSNLINYFGNSVQCLQSRNIECFKLLAGPFKLQVYCLGPWDRYSLTNFVYSAFDRTFIPNRFAWNSRYYTRQSYLFSPDAHGSFSMVSAPNLLARKQHMYYFWCLCDYCVLVFLCYWESINLTRLEGDNSHSGLESRKEGT